MGNRIEKRASIRQARKIVGLIHEEGMFKTWMRDDPNGWRLSDGSWSPFYITLKNLPGSESRLYRISVDAVANTMKDNGFVAGPNTKVVGIAMGGLALANGIALMHGIPALYTRKLPEDVRTPGEVKMYLKAHGERELVQGKFNEDTRLCIVDDLASTLTSKLLAKVQIENEAVRRHFKKPVNVKQIFVLIKRGEEAQRKAEGMGLELHAAVNLLDGLPVLREEGKISDMELDVISESIVNSRKLQDHTVQKGLIELARKGNPIISKV